MGSRMISIVPLSLVYNMVSFFNREKRFKEEIEIYRQERPKIQQQFSDLKVIIFIAIMYVFSLRIQPLHVRCLLSPLREASVI